MIKIIWRLLLVNLLLAWPVAASTNPVPESLALPMCVTQALSHAAVQGVLDDKVLAAQAELDRVRSQSYPHLNITPGAKIYTEGGTTEAEMRADLGPLFLEIPQNIVRKRIAVKQVQYAEQYRARAAAEYGAHAIRSFLGCLGAEQKLHLAKQRFDAASAAEVGWKEITSNERVVADKRADAAELAAGLRLALTQARTSHDLVHKQLNRLCGFPVQARITLTPPPPYKLPEVTAKQCQAWAISNRTDLVAATLKLEQADQLIKLANMGRLPRPHLSFGYNREDEGEALNEVEDGAFARIGIEIPVWDGGETKARVKKLKAERISLQRGVGDLASQIEGEAAQALIMLQQAAQRLRAARRDNKADEAFKRSQFRHKRGDISDADWKQAQIQLNTHKALLAEKNWACFEAEAGLLAAIQASRDDLHKSLVP